MADLTWEGNSKAMFDKLIESSPKPFRAMTEKKGSLLLPEPLNSILPATWNM